MRSLNRSALNEQQISVIDEVNASPITVLQIGEGNFLRGFFDWMVHESRKQGLFKGSIAVTQPRPSGKPKIEALAGQDGIYTLVVRGIENGANVERTEVISVFAEAFDPYTDWEKMCRLAVSPDLQFVVSNTTEAGLVYRPEPLTEGTPIVSFPGKVAYLLYRRYLAFEGASDRGLILLPCELLERNGDSLKEAVLKYAADWELPVPFAEWVRTSNRFLNSLVDRIVTGYPDQDQAESWFSDWGYRDELLSTTEPYHLWAIEGEPKLDERLPLQSAGLNVLWVDDLKPYQQRKVRILNGAHTLMTPLGILHGVEHVRELMEHERLGAFVRTTVMNEIIPSLPYPEVEMRAYADGVFERYSNPYIRHRLADIAMNSLSKFKARLIPSLSHYAERGEPIPEGLLLGFAALIRYYRVYRNGDQYEGVSLLGSKYVVRDDANALETIAAIWAKANESGQELAVMATQLLSESALWGQDLNRWPGVAEAVTSHLTEWTTKETRT
jgi:tagaturonate reductase